MNLFVQVVLPVILIFLTGFFLQRVKRMDIKSISTVALYILAPCLVFRTFYKAELNTQYVMIVFFSLLLLFFLIMISKIYSRLKGYPQSIESGLILSTAFMNAGNYGAPIMLFAYGELGFAYSISFFVTQSIIMNCFGIYYAARGKTGMRMAVQSVFKMPQTYALFVALLMQGFNIEVPGNIFSAIDLVAQATIPMVMLILGMQLAEIKSEHLQWGKISYGILIRMFASPLIAFGIVYFLPMDPLLQKVLIVSAAMPSAATTTMYALQFDSEPKLVSSITLYTTLVSIVTITILLSILG